MKKKPPKKSAAPAKPHVWHIGERVMKQGMIGPYEITRVGPDDVDLCLVGARFELFRVPIRLIAPVE